MEKMIYERQPSIEETSLTLPSAPRYTQDQNHHLHLVQAAMAASSNAMGARGDVTMFNDNNNNPNNIKIGSSICTKNNNNAATNQSLPFSSGQTNVNSCLLQSSGDKSAQCASQMSTSSANNCANSSCRNGSSPGRAGNFGPSSTNDTITSEHNISPCSNQCRQSNSAMICETSDNQSWSGDVNATCINGSANNVHMQCENISVTTANGGSTASGIHIEMNNVNGSAIMSPNKRHRRTASSHAAPCAKACSESNSAIMSGALDSQVTAEQVAMKD